MLNFKMDLSKLDFEHFIYIRVSRPYTISGMDIDIISSPASFIEHILSKYLDPKVVYDALLEGEYIGPNNAIIKVPRDLKDYKEYSYIF